MKTHFGVVSKVLDDGWLRLWDLENTITHTVDGTDAKLGAGIEGRIVKFTLENEDVLGQIDLVPVELLPKKLQHVVNLRSSPVLGNWARRVMGRLVSGRDPKVPEDIVDVTLAPAGRPAIEAESEQKAATAGKPEIA